MTLSRRQRLAWSQKAFRDGYMGNEYAAAHAREFAGEEAELAYAAGFRVGKRERLKLKKVVA